MSILQSFRLWLKYDTPHWLYFRVQMPLVCLFRGHHWFPFKNTNKVICANCLKVKS